MISAHDPSSDEAIVAALGTAHISVEIVEFHDLFTATGSLRCRGTRHRIRLARPHPRVSIDPEDPGTLVIRPGGATLRLTLSPPEFFPLGITFELQEGDPTAQDNDRLGFLNADQLKIRPDGHTLSVTDEFKDWEADDRYKFSIIIQRGADGRIGIVDPGIRHLPF